jgi:hypothetical protein
LHKKIDSEKRIACLRVRYVGMGFEVYLNEADTFAAISYRVAPQMAARMGRTNVGNHLRHVLLSYMAHHNEARTHLSLSKDAPMPREVQIVERIFAKPHLGGLHHQYVRI